VTASVIAVTAKYIEVTQVFINDRFTRQAITTVFSSTRGFSITIVILKPLVDEKTVVIACLVNLSFINTCVTSIYFAVTAITEAVTGPRPLWLPS